MATHPWSVTDYSGAKWLCTETEGKRIVLPVLVIYESADVIEPFFLIPQHLKARIEKHLLVKLFLRHCFGAAWFSYFHSQYAPRG